MQMAFAFDRVKVHEWTLTLRRTSVLVYYILWPFGFGVIFLGSHIARNEDEAGVAIAVGLVICALGGVPVIRLSYLARVNLQVLYGKLNPTSTSAKTLATQIKLLGLMVLFCCNCCNTFMLLGLVPWLHHRSGTAFITVILPSGFVMISAAGMFYIYTARHGAKRAGHRDTNLMSSTNTIISNTNMSERQVSIGDVIKTSKQEMASGLQTRRSIHASHVVDSGVSLSFLEAFLDQNSIDASWACDAVVNAHVKPHTKEIGNRGSGAYVELIQGSKDSDGHYLSKTPTHMLSYSWKYKLQAIIEMLRKFELDFPPHRGTCNYYFIDQFALDQHGFGHEFTSKKQVQDAMISTLKESIQLPGKMICMLHPWDAPVPLTRVWCLFELYLAIMLKSEIIMCFPPADAAAFYGKLTQEPLGGEVESAPLVPKIEVRNAEATVEADRVRILDEITEAIDLDAFNEVLQSHMEGALQQVATSALLAMGGVDISNGLAHSLADRLGVKGAGGRKSSFVVHVHVDVQQKSATSAAI
jgi:hypothetical protein